MGLTKLIYYSISMFLSTLLCSFLPLRFKSSSSSSSSTIKLFSIYSIGLLLGSSLSIIIPEGINEVYKNIPTSIIAKSGEIVKDHNHSLVMKGKILESIVVGTEGRGELPEMTNYIGLALLSGFILMYLIDSLHPHTSSSRPSSSSSLINSSTSISNSFHHHHRRASLYRGPQSELEALSASGTPLNSPPKSREGSPALNIGDWEERGLLDNNGGGAAGEGRISNSSYNTVIGLLVHSLADGISLGAACLSSSSSSTSSSSSSTKNSIDLIIFTAILLHKAPTSFALSIILQSDPKASRGFIKKSLILFSLAAPLGGLVTYFFITLLGGVGGEGGEGGTLGWWTGIILLFSGGTFLQVATVQVGRVKSSGGHNHTGGGEGDGGEEVGERVRCLLVILGMITPGLLSRVISHTH